MPVGPSIKNAAGSANPNVYERAAVVARAAGFDLHALSYTPGVRSSAAALVAALQRLSGEADQAAGPKVNLGIVSQAMERDYFTVKKDGSVLIGVIHRKTS
jgi:hypothetical protein